MRVYISGRFSSPDPKQREKNIRLADKYALKIWKLGFDVFCPHTMTQSWVGKVKYWEMICSDLNWLSVCDILFLLPGWQKSRGARVEVEVALKLGIPVYQSFKKLKEVRKCLGKSGKSLRESREFIEKISRRFSSKEMEQ